MTATEEEPSRSEASVNVVHEDKNQRKDEDALEKNTRSVLDALVRARLEENTDGRRRSGGLGRLPQHEFWETQPVGQFGDEERREELTEGPMSQSAPRAKWNARAERFRPGTSGVRAI